MAIQQLIPLLHLLGLTLLSGAAVSHPLTPRQSGDDYNYSCGPHDYNANDINDAVAQGASYLKSGRTFGAGRYPHKYRNDEHFSFPTDGPWYEFPILASGKPYAGGSPGADRVIFDSNSNFDSVITHTDAGGDGFVACAKDG